jgi:hypothetical protein
VQQLAQDCEKSSDGDDESGDGLKELVEFVCIHGITY